MRGRVLVVLGLVLLIGADTPEDKASREEHAKAEGTWVAISVVLDGKPIPERGEMTFKGNTFHLGLKGKTHHKGTHHFDPTKRLKTVDLNISEGVGKGKTRLGIYEVRADGTIRVCLAPPGEARPTAFASKAGSGHVLVILKKKTPP